MKFTEIIGFTAAISFMGFCLSVSLYCLTDSRRVVSGLQFETGMEKSVLERDDTSMNYAYLSRPGAYMAAAQLALSVAYMGADTDISVNFFGDIYSPIDKREMSFETVAYSSFVYEKLSDWFDQFKSSAAYSSSGVHGFAVHGTDTVYLRPSELSDCKFKLQAVDREIDENEYTKLVDKDIKSALKVSTGDASQPFGYYAAEFRPFIFLGYYDQGGALRYSWFECLSDGGVKWLPGA